MKPSTPASDYTIVKISDIDYDISREGLTHPYQVDIHNGTCSCPHWTHRLRHSGRACKHIKMVRAAIKEGRVL